MATQYALTQLVWPVAGVVGIASVTVTAPDGTVSTVAATSTSMQNPAALTAWFTPQQVGVYQIVWTSTGGQTTSSTLTVTAAVPPASVMSLNDCYNTLKLDLSLQGTVPARDADMLAYAAAAQTAVEGIVGPIAPTTLTEVFDGGPGTLLLRAKPTSIVSVTVNGVAAGNWVPDFHAAVLLSTGAGFPPGYRNVVVTYTAGSGQVRPNVLLGVRETFRQVWERSRALGGQATPDIVMQGFAVPNAVYELLAADVLIPGLA